MHPQPPRWAPGQEPPNAGGATPPPVPRTSSAPTEGVGVKPAPCKNVQVEEKSLSQINLPPPVEHEKFLPIGLKLTITPSFLELVEEALARSLVESTTTRLCKKTCRVVNKVGVATPRKELAGDKEKQKASNFPASLLKIGSWERRSLNAGDLVVKCYFAKQRLVWEILEGGLKRKIEIEWNDISAIRETSLENRCTLEVELDRQPHFFHETDPQPRKHTQWLPATDFTGGQAMICRRHYVECPEGNLHKHYEKLLECDSRLRELTTRPFPSAISPYFSAGHGSTEDYACNVDKHKIEIPSKFSHHLAYGSSNTATHGPRNISIQQAESPQSFTTIGNKCPPINCISRANSPSYIKNPLGDHGIQQLQGTSYEARRFTRDENLNSFYPIQNRQLEAIEEHLMGDHELPMCVDEQKVAARVRSMNSLLEENDQVAEKK